MKERIIHQVGYKTKMGWLVTAFGDSAQEARAVLKIRIVEMGRTIQELNVMGKYHQEKFLRN